MKLHIYGQSHEHEHAFIVGDELALRELADAIYLALDKGNGKATLSAADGEGFDLEVYLEEDPEYWDKSRLPYTENLYFGDKIEIGPWDLYKKYKK